MARDPRIVALEIKLEELKHQYDLYLSGRRRTEPVNLKSDAEREILALTRFPSSSTMFKFQVKTLAMRFRAMETQVRNLLDLRQLRASCSGKTVVTGAMMNDIVVDEMAIDNPAIIANKVRALLSQAGGNALLPGTMTPEALCDMMLNKAKAIVGKNNVKAVKYSLVTSEQGPRVKGELVTALEANSN